MTSTAEGLEHKLTSGGGHLPPTKKKGRREEEDTPTAASLVHTYAMFFNITLQRNLQLHPRHFGPNLHSTLVQKLHSEVEGSCSGRYGFIIMVTAVVSIGKGQVVSGNGFVTFPITYKAVVFRPFKGEVVDAVVTQVNKMGFMAEVGPLQVFVSKHLIPSDMNFDANDECFVSDDESIRISKDDEVRLKIVGTRVDASELFSIGSIKEDFLGPIS